MCFLDGELQLLRDRNARLLTCQLLLQLVCVGLGVLHAAQDLALLVLVEQLGQQIVAGMVLGHCGDQALERRTGRLFCCWGKRLLPKGESSLA